MDTIYMGLVLTTMAVFCAALIYWIVTMIQIRRTAKAFETFLVHADESAVVLSQASQKAAGILSFAMALKNQFFKKANGTTKEEIRIS